jgi:hypothetical protein
MKKLFSLLSFNLIFLFTLALNAQDTIYLLNASFEDAPRKGSEYYNPIKHWSDCGIKNFPGESPPDIHPVKDNAWDVSKEARDGATYLGMVTRYTNTYESVSQLLGKPIEAGKCYSISVYLALSEQYNSPTPRSSMDLKSYGRNQTPKMTTENFSNPVELLIWGGHDYCQRVQLLVHSGAINNHDWKYYSLEISPEESFEYITIGAFFVFGYTEPYNGHILVDGLSPIIEIECK